MAAKSEVIPLSRNKFQVPVYVRDPKTGGEYEIACEIDTGAPDSLLLPRSLDSNFNVSMGTYDRRGAGLPDSPAYSVEIFGLGDLRFSFQDMAIMALPKPKPFEDEIGLVGTDFLKYCYGELDGKPHSKTLEIQTTYI